MGDEFNMSGFRLPTYLEQLPQVGASNVLGSGMASLPSNAAYASPVSAGGSLFDSFFSTRNPTTGLASGGWGTAAMGIGQGLMNGWMGMQQLDLAKDTLAFNKDAFNKNYKAQLGATRGAITDQASARYAGNPNAYGNDRDKYITKQLSSYGVA